METLKFIKNLENINSIATERAFKRISDYLSNEFKKTENESIEHLSARLAQRAQPLK